MDYPRELSSSPVERLDTAEEAPAVTDALWGDGSTTPPSELPQ